MPKSRAPTPDQLQSPSARLLRPLVRLFIRAGLTFPALCDLLREIYVSVAETEFALKGKEQTDSRVSLLTGIHRKEVRRLRGAGAPVSAVPSSVSRSSRIVGTWLASPRFTDSEGRPRPLPRHSDDPAEASFDDLVEEVTRDVRPRAILDEWLSRDLVRLDDEGRLVLSEAAYIPESGSEQQLYYFGRNLHDHLAASVTNVLGGKPFFERAVHYDGLSEGVAARLEGRARDIAMQALQTANREAHAACETGPEAAGAWRWNFGIYVYREEAGPATDKANDEARA